MIPKKPNFIIIGSAKCGTTTLASILDHYPDCCFSRPKEMHFFQDMTSVADRHWTHMPGFPKEVYSAQDMTWNHSDICGPNPKFLKGWDWYSKGWSHYSGEALVGEATPDYSDRTNSPQTASRIFNFNPEMKIIYMVRQPLQRQLSSWRMHYVQGTDDVPNQYMGDKWAWNGFTYWMRSQQLARQWDEVKYNFQLDAYREFFPQKNILVSFLEDWRTDLNGEMVRIARFLGLDSDKMDLGDPRGENRAEQRREARKWIPMLLRTGLPTLAGRFMSPAAKRLLMDKVVLRKFKFPEPDMTPDLLADFKSFVAEDNAKFLNHYGKPATFWDEGWNYSG
jgi:Sulfotransferase family